MEKNKRTATFGGGCFWCVEAIMQRIRGVETVVSGYAGGHRDAPTYKEVCTGTTGHAEVVQVVFDAEVIGYKDLLRLFLTSHDPTTVDRQGGDVGSQYRSVILWHDEGQRKDAQEVLAEMGPLFPAPIVTQLVPFTMFHPAEDYHGNYFNGNGEAPYCQAVIAPKVAKFRKQHAALLKAEYR